jgi:hypothetical protein
MANDSCVFENYKSEHIFRIYYNTSIAKAREQTLGEASATKKVCAEG